MRRSILRVRLNTDELKDGKALVASGSTPKIKNRRITNNFYFESSSEDEENTTCKSRTIDRVNLAESIRKSLLRVNLNRDEFNDGKASVISGSTPKRKNRGTTKNLYFDSSSEDGEHATCKSKTIDRVNLAESIRKSVLRVNLNRDEFKDGKASVVSEDGEYATCKSKTIDRVNLDESIRKSVLSVSLNRDELRDGKNINCISSTLVIPKTPTTRTKSRTSTVDISQSKYGSTIVPKTPKTRKNIVTPKNTIKQTPKSTVQTPKTPRNRAKLIRDGLITPSMQSRRKLLDGCGGCMYISGVPGTGKTATVTSVINNLLENDDVPKFSCANINGMRLTEPRQSYVEILKQLTGKMVPWEQAHSMLEERFTKSKKFAPVIMLIDELDILCTKRQDVVYNLLDWPTKAKNQLIVVTIANTMDLPERLLMNRVTSRLGLTRLTFQAYTHKQLQEIVTKRLSGTNSFNPDAIQFVARKVASVSGDARRALDICRRAAEIAETEGKNQLVNMSHVNEALNAMITQPKVRAIKHCSRLEQLLLQSIVAEVERTGVEETTFADVFKMLVSCTAIDGFRMVSSTVALSAVSRLSACRLILTDQKCSDINQRVILNVSVDDVYYALKRD
ncbi:hypothetical protein NQ314_015864 [Rhamnusium bicolor]|uniref:Origin recognition complex subunit 1 n=1 Tax=Rhamnusium bicolor TaxID=1586634 RepID=A0AAV8WYC8_9CUCU|nr:hypothetical protein NQ314_015864 [Rhamnusium bicolor]